MPRRDWWWRFLARVLPWFDAAAYDRDREQSRIALEQADRVMGEKPDRIRDAYDGYARRLAR